MATKKNRKPRYVTDTGEALFPYLVEPDTEFNPDGDYKVRLLLDPSANALNTKSGETLNLQGFLDEMMEKSYELAKEQNSGRIKRADPPYEIDETTGQLKVNFKLKRKGKTRDGQEFTQQPALFDAKLNPYEGPEIWGGSKIKCSFEVAPYYTKLLGAGITLRLKGAQIIEMAERNTVSGGAFGFGEETGYEAAAHNESDEDSAGHDFEGAENIEDKEEYGDF